MLEEFWGTDDQRKILLELFDMKPSRWRLTDKVVYLKKQVSGYTIKSAMRFPGLISRIRKRLCPSK